MAVIHLYSKSGISSGRLERLVKKLTAVHPFVIDLEAETCYNIQVPNNLTKDEMSTVIWLLSEPFVENSVYDSTKLLEEKDSILVEIGPRLNFSTAYSSNALSICKMVGLTSVSRIEVSTRYLIRFVPQSFVAKDIPSKLIDQLHDKLTECEYQTPLETFDHGITAAAWSVVDVLGEGRQALESVNKKLGLAFDAWDLDFYTDLFKNKLQRNPTTVECFDLAQSNSEHSRHWFFKGKLIVDKTEYEQSLFEMIMATQENSNQNNVIKFSDNSSAIKGFKVRKIIPKDVCKPSEFRMIKSKLNLIFTAETHNFPTGVAPFSGATTGTGGRIRDVQAVGRGGNCVAGTAGYSVGNLLIPGYEQPWENKSWVYPDNLARPLKILIDASDGASDYGNKFGEPIIAGFTRASGISVGPKDQNMDRLEWVKPIMFTGGIGTMEEVHSTKLPPAKGMKILKIGGPVYRIGVGGGAASSIEVQGDNESDLDFGAVQRGDAEMENKLNRLIRCCNEDPEGTPILSIHDQGAGGNGNVLKEIVEPEGAVIFTKLFSLGDETVSTLELWGAEYQESNAILVAPESLTRLEKMAKRERCPIDVVGSVTGLKNLVLSEEEPNFDKYMDGSYKKSGVVHPFDLDLELVLGKMPRKKYHLGEGKYRFEKMVLSPALTLESALERVLRHPTVCSKRFLTNKVDRCVTGLIAQQQCVGPLHTPLADYAVTALSMFDTVGSATSIGEQPIKGILCPQAGARMSVAEALSNLVFVKISSLKDIKCSGNWMWPAKLLGEGANLFRACKAMCDFMSELGIAVDGGKDSLSMAARVQGKTIKSPGTLVISAYAPCPDVRKKVTPDLKGPAMNCSSKILWIRSSTKYRLGGSILGQTFLELGDEVPDIDDAVTFAKAFNITQELIGDDMILSGHDVSDGGVITTLIEMAIGGLVGFNARFFEVCNSNLKVLFTEESSWIIEVKDNYVARVIKSYEERGVSASIIGITNGYGMQAEIKVKDKYGSLLMRSCVANMFMMWEETSYKLECLQANHNCVTQEFKRLTKRTGPTYELSFDPEVIPRSHKTFSSSPVIAILREEGTNGDREMATSFQMAGFAVWDVTMQDLVDRSISVESFRGIVFPGGFSYADVLGSAKGWAACLMFNPTLKAQFDFFKQRSDTFSFGVCNGCQLMALLGWVGNLKEWSGCQEQGVFLNRNASDRFECRFSTVSIAESRSIMTHDMAGSKLGVWIAHGEGRFTYKNDDVYKNLNKNKCLPFRYINDEGRPTEFYPMNPNGSSGGVAGICSEDGRHLAMMPHPERTTLMWQWPYIHPEISSVTTSPWMRLFHNAFVWAQENQA